ncbi:hypothetical protein M0805_008168 [Coniferiporia weirii]|nr:hypothetical protein M0805_008168 [Coniferiporia weirii]
MGIMDTIARSIASFTIIDDLDECSSGTDTYVERRRSSQPKRSTAAVTVTPTKEPSRRAKSTDKRDHRKMIEVVEVKKEKEKEVVVEKVEKEIKEDKSKTRLRDELKETLKERTKEGEGAAKGTSEDVRKENRTLKRRQERMEKDISAYRRHVEQYRAKRKEAERERERAEDRCKELETIVSNMRESYEQELEDLREQMAQAAAPAHVAEPSLRAPTVQAPSVHGSTTRRSAAKGEYTAKEAPSVIHSEATDPILSQLPRPRSLAEYPVPLPPTTEDSHAASVLLVQLEERDAELRALRLFHNEEPQLSVSELAASVRALNAELADIASAVAESIPLGRTWELAQAWALEAAEPALERCLRLLAGPPGHGMKGMDYAEDPTLVRLALQAWTVMSFERVFSQFLFGLEETEDELLRRLYERVQSIERPQVAARWRALTRRAARPAGFTSSLYHAAHVLEMDVLSGFESLLRFAGAHSPPGVLFSELSGVHGRRVGRAVRRAVRLTEALAEKAPPGYEVFTVDVIEGEEGGMRGNGAGVGEGEQGGKGDDGKAEQGVFLCECMDSVDTDARRWAGLGRTRKSGTNTGRSKSRGGTHTARSKSKGGTRTGRSKSRGRTERSRTDTNVRDWDRDDSDDTDEEEEEEEDILHAGPNHAGAVVVCSLGFGLRRVMRQKQRRKQPQVEVKEKEQELQRERRRGQQAEVETVKDSKSKSSYSILSTSISASTSTSSSSSGRTERQQAGATQITERVVGAPDKDGGRRTWADGEAEVVVKASVLMSSTIDLLQRRFVG